SNLADGASDHQPPAGAPQTAGHRLEDALALDRRRQGRHLEDRVVEPRFELLADLSRPTDAENGRKADHFPGDEAGPQVGDDRRAETGVLEALCEAEGAEVPLHSERRRQLERAGGDGPTARQLRPRDVAREVGGIEVLEPAQPDEDEAPTAAE